jgi:hypothetical protein
MTFYILSNRFTFTKKSETREIRFLWRWISTFLKRVEATHHFTDIANSCSRTWHILSTRKKPSTVFQIERDHILFIRLETINLKKNVGIPTNRRATGRSE